MFIDNPVFGIGPGAYRYACQNDEYITFNACTTHPHNYFLQMLTETGIIGFTVYYFFCFI